MIAVALVAVAIEGYIMCRRYAKYHKIALKHQVEMEVHRHNREIIATVYGKAPPRGLPIPREQEERREMFDRKARYEENLMYKYRRLWLYPWLKEEIPSESTSP
jgi:hypothetical protein